MAIGPEARNHGVSPMPPQTGSRGMDGKGVHLPESTYENPGPTSNIRGIEPNTDWGWASTAPVVPVVDTIEGYTRDEPFIAPQDSLGDVDGDAPDGWTTADSSSQNSALPEPQVGSFTKFGEEYPG